MKDEQFNLTGMKKSGEPFCVEVFFTDGVPTGMVYKDPSGLGRVFKA